MAENVILTLTQTVRDTEKLGELYYKCGRILWDTNENNRVDKSKCLAMFLKVIYRICC